MQKKAIADIKIEKKHQAEFFNALKISKFNFTSREYDVLISDKEDGDLRYLDKENAEQEIFSIIQEDYSMFTLFFYLNEQEYSLLTICKNEKDYFWVILSTIDFPYCDISGNYDLILMNNLVKKITDSIILQGVSVIETTPAEIFW